MHTLIVLLFSIFLGATGQVLLKVAVNQIGGVDLSIAHLPSTISRLLLNGWLMLGICMFGISMLLWLKVISDTDLSRAYPSVSLSYIIVFFFSVVLFKETVTITKLVGIVSILFGVFMIHR